MARIVVHLARPVRRRFLRLSRKTGDARLRTRIQIVLRYHDGWGSTSIARALDCAEATAIRVARRFLDMGEPGFLDGRRENGTPKVDSDLLQALAEIVQKRPPDFGWKRPTWTRELMIQVLEQETGQCVSVTTVARMLKRLGMRWGTAKAIVLCPWPRERKSRRLRQIRRALDALPPGEVAYYQDEVDIHLNPRIGRDWMLKGKQKTVVTPGQNKKRYLAGALSVDGTDLVFVAGDRKNTDLFLAHLEELKSQNPRARRIHLVLDNYSIHSSKKARRYLEEEKGRFVLHFLPPYTPEENRIERLWQDLHANVTRNHRCTSIEELMDEVVNYMDEEGDRRSVKISNREAG